MKDQNLYTKPQFCELLDRIDKNVMSSNVDDLVFHSRLILEDMGLINKEGIKVLTDFLRALATNFPEHGVVNFKFDTMPFKEELNNLQMVYNDELKTKG